jgi:F-type H+-transporting ATPase subunit epsilon
MRLDLITPKKQVFSDEVESVTVPTSTGEITILPHHIDLLSRISPGEIVARTKAREYSFAITGGILQVAQNVITVLGDYAVRAEDIEISRAQAAQKRAKEAMDKRSTEEDFAEARAELSKSLLELKVAERHHKRRTTVR